jgi:3-hydroxy-4-methylanthranilate adenylyltransferase
MNAIEARRWVDEGLLGGAPHEVCLRLGRDITRAELTALVDEWERHLRDAGLVAGGTCALRLPPSVTYVGALLAGWRVGAQVSLLDHRLTQAEVERALERVGAQLLVTATGTRGHRLCGYAEVTAAVTARPGGRPADTDHVLVQFSSGSTGASKVIARTTASLADELARYDRLPEYPRRGGRIVLLASSVHVLGLVGGLLYALHAGARLVYPERLTAEGILDAVRADPTPAMVLGVPFYAELLVAAGRHDIPQLSRMVVAGELVRPGVPQRFRDAYGVALGTMYGMTEFGVIATDLDGALWPSVRPTEGTRVRAEAGELCIAMDATPYIGLVDPTRYADGWLRTRDAATVDEATGLVTILGRLDSQISIGGLKVDLTEVEQTIGALPGVVEAVVVHDGDIEAYLSLGEPTTAQDVTAGLARELAPFKRPRRLHVLDRLPRTATGKIVRDPAVLKAATGGE